jgi:hypothetical protein
MASINAMTWYPLVFLLARRGLLENRPYWTVAAGLFLGMENLAGHWQHAVYLGLLLFLYFAYEACAGPQRSALWPRWIYQLALIAAIGAGLAAVQIVPTFQLSQLSIRTQLTSLDVMQASSPRYLWTLFLPNFFGGLNGVPYQEGIEPSMNYLFLTVPGCLLALLGLAEMARRRNFFWLGLILVLSDVSLGGNGYLGQFLYQVPVLNLFRWATTFFDLVNFGLCLMAAVGLKTLSEESSRAFYRRRLPVFLVALLMTAAGIGLAYRFAGQIHGWYHMLAVLALFSLLTAAWLRGGLGHHLAQWSVLALTVFELCHYSMNQTFNRSAGSPRTVLSYDYAANRKESLEFLRADGGGDFRTAAIDGFPWGGNGSNVWRIPSILGWNPIMLRGYQEYIRQVFLVDGFTLPFGPNGHRLDSPLLDLLGVKYLLVLTPDEKEQGIAELHKFEKAFAEPDWRVIYRNKDYLSRAWFYPRAYVLPDRAAALAMMNSRWFQFRRTLLFARPDLPGDALANPALLDSHTFLPDQVVRSSTGSAKRDESCAEARYFFADWGGRGNWIRFDAPGLSQPGRYVLLAEYGDAYSVPPLIQASVIQEGRERAASSTPVALPPTRDWTCAATRMADLGEFDLVPGPSQITLTSLQDTAINLFSLWLVRLPDDHPSETPAFVFRDFEVSATRVAFRAELPQAGYVFLNEMDYPGWEATIDGTPAVLLRANGIFRAVWAPAGVHQIEMRFRPHYLALGAGISLMSLVGIAVSLVLLRPSRRASSEQDAAA